MLQTLFLVFVNKLDYIVKPKLQNSAVKFVFLGKSNELYHFPWSFRGICYSAWNSPSAYKRTTYIQVMYEKNTTLKWKQSQRWRSNSCLEIMEEWLIFSTYMSWWCLHWPFEIIATSTRPNNSFVAVKVYFCFQLIPQLVVSRSFHIPAQ